MRIAQLAPRGRNLNQSQWQSKGREFSFGVFNNPEMAMNLHVAVSGEKKT